MSALVEVPFELDAPVESIQIPDVSCPRCGGGLFYVNGRSPGASGYAAMVLLRCARTPCPTWELRVELITCGAPPAAPRPLKVSA